jgi:fumarate hydratase class II
MSGSLRTLAISLIKIANDIRWLASGPRCGIGEIKLPDIQPGSSIMPGKVNPVMCESVLQVAAYVIGCDAAIALCGQSGNFELNVMMPIMALSFLGQITFTANVVRAFTDKCVKGIEADVARCQEMVGKSLAIATALVPIIGYDLAAKIAQEAFLDGKTVKEVALKYGILPKEKLDDILDPVKMAKSGPLSS